MSISENNVLFLKFKKNVLGIMTGFFASIPKMAHNMSKVAHRAKSLEFGVWSSNI